MFANVTGVSDDGQVVATTFQTGVGQRVYAWTENEGVRLLDHGPGAGRGFAFALSAGGSHVTGTYHNASFGVRKTARWDVATGARDDIDFLAGVRSEPAAISADGSTVVGILQQTDTITRAFRWTAAGGQVDIGALGGVRSIARDVSASGDVVVGGAQDALGQWQAFRWTPSLGMRRIPTGGAPSYAVLVSDDGATVVGTTPISNFPSGVFLRRPGLGVIEVPLNGGYLSYFGSLRMSADGSTVAGFAVMPSNTRRAFVWNEVTGTTLLPAQYETAIDSVSSDGSSVVGTYRQELEDPHRAFRWTPAAGFEPLDDPGGSRTFVAAMTPDGTVAIGHSILNGNEHPVVWRFDGQIGASYCGSAVVNSSGGAAEIGLRGSNSIALDAMTLVASDMPSGSFGYFLASRAPGFTFPVAGSDGALCLGGSIGRFVGPGQVQPTGASGAFELTVPTTALPTPTASVTPTFGESWYFQAWFRDVTATGQSNFTNGATVRFY